MALDKSNEIAGAGKYPSTRLRQKERKILELAEVYEAADASDWDTSAPVTLSDAIDRIANHVANSGTGAIDVLP